MVEELHMLTSMVKGYMLQLHVVKCNTRVQVQVQAANAIILSLMCAYKYSWLASPET